MAGRPVSAYTEGHPGRGTSEMIGAGYGCRHEVQGLGPGIGSPSVYLLWIRRTRPWPKVSSPAAQGKLATCPLNNSLQGAMWAI